MAGKTFGRAAARASIHRQTAAPKDPRKWGAKCDLCPLKGSPYVWGDGNPKALIAFIGEAPGREETKVQVPFVGKSGELLEAFLGRLKLTRGEVWLDNAIMCFPPGGELREYLQRKRKEYKGTDQEFHNPVDCCRPRLFHALGVPKCGGCGKWLRGPDELVCRCQSPLGQVRPRDDKGLRHHIPVVQPMGNAGLESTLGVSGITERRGYYEDMKARQQRLRGKREE